MNLAHRWLCRSAYWRNAVETYTLPWALDGLDIGANVLEVGPGPGVTTDLLRVRNTNAYFWLRLIREAKSAGVVRHVQPARKLAYFS
jgi:hypothetical protein